MNFREQEYWTGQACRDFILLLANGDIPHDWDEARVAQWMADIAKEMEGFATVTLGHVHEEPHCSHPGERCPDDADCDCQELGFRTTSCDHCGSSLHGDREAVTFWRNA